MRLALLVCALLTPATQAQWQLQQSNTSASLRGIHALGSGIAWASGTEGTILRTTDQGQHWQRCTTPPAAEHLDFRGIQAFDAQTAIVMSSGKGDLSRLYKTTDACQTWKLIFTNPDKEGFWDAINFNAPSHDQLGRPLDHSHAWGQLLGDPVDGAFTLFSTGDGGETWSRRTLMKRGPKGDGCKVDIFNAKPKESVFAASNGSLLSLVSGELLFVTGGSVAQIGYTGSFSLDGALCHDSTHLRDLPINHGNTSSGAFALAASQFPSASNFPEKVVVVGGDYKLPDAADHNAVIVNRPGTFLQTVREATTPPHGYRSSVAYLPTQKAWITVGPNGTDVSTDDGRNWHALKPQPGEALDSDRNWNALSLPFVVGPHGRIGLLTSSALSDEPRSRPVKGTASAVP